jgi:glutamate-ammonia-ligase adenylyltransferase
MTLEKKLLDHISDVALLTPDPERSARNMTRFCERNPQYIPPPADLPCMAKLFAISQFLANYCTAVPVEFSSALGELNQSIDLSSLGKKAIHELPDPEKKEGGSLDAKDLMQALRIFKKKYLLRITLRDITGKTDIQSSMAELSCLAEAIIGIALTWSLELNQQKFGKPAKSSIALISLGKLGGEELNYSSDVDLIGVYDNDDGQTSGILNPSGFTYSRISNHEFYCKVVELFNRILSAHTEDGIVYRVDLRLRPQGQKGDIILPLKAYRTYYESWGRTWERMVLIRARPVAGNKKLGKAFMQSIDPFVWKKTPVMILRGGMVVFGRQSSSFRPFNCFMAEATSH